MQKTGTGGSAERFRFRSEQLLAEARSSIRSEARREFDTLGQSSKRDRRLQRTDIPEARGQGEQVNHEGQAERLAACQE